MYCKLCVHRRQDSLWQRLFYCSSPKLVELSASSREQEYDPNGDKLVYSYEENGTFYVEDNFGCVHFEAKIEQGTSESETEAKAEPNDLITVCDCCLRASCWQGVFYCDNYMESGTVQKTRSELIALNLENPSYFKTDAQLANEGE